MREKFKKTYSHVLSIISIEHCWIFMLLLFFMLRLPDFMANAFVPDEIWHTSYMRTNQNLGYLSIENYQGHGGAFWYFKRL